MVFCWHTELIPRIERILENALGTKIPVLDPGKVAPAKRQEWIQKNVVETGARVLITNPVCIQTGLNNLVHFASEWWHENPVCNPVIFRQARGRVDLIGQKLETSIYVPYYRGTAQDHAYTLLMHKVGVSMATDGLDAESALQAAGVGEFGVMTGFSVGKALYKLLGDSY